MAAAKFGKLKKKSVKKEQKRFDSGDQYLETVKAKEAKEKAEAAAQAKDPAAPPS